MPIIPFDSYGGFSINGATFADSSRNVYAVGATFTGTVFIGATGVTSIVGSLNGFYGGVSITAGSNVTINNSGNVITISSSGGGGPAGATGPTGPTGPRGSTGPTGSFQDGTYGDIEVTGGGLTLNIIATLDTIPVAVTGVNFNSQQALNFRIENRTSDPASPTSGQIWLRTDL
jgi:hypothetical protein